jgi:NADPH2:quinone reductase
MIAIEIRDPGGPDVLRAVDRPIPSVGPTDVLLKVAAAGVNRPDLMQRQGRYAPPPGAPDIPGLEIAGVIDKVGESAQPWSGAVRVPVHATFPLRAAADAHRTMEESQHFGKLVLVA